VQARSKCKINWIVVCATDRLKLAGPAKKRKAHARNNGEVSFFKVGMKSVEEKHASSGPSALDNASAPNQQNEGDVGLTDHQTSSGLQHLES